METIEAILFEPVGCLADFPPEPFNEIAAQLFGRRNNPTKSASRAYWHLLNLMDVSDRKLDRSEVELFEDLEVQAVKGATLYEDVVPALVELKRMGIPLFLTSSLSEMAVARFLEKGCDYFSAVWSRDSAEGIKDVPLRSACEAAVVTPGRAMFLADTAEALKTGKAAGVNAVLMMNDPDEARRLAAHEPAGGIVSLQELPDFVRFLAAKNTERPGGLSIN